MISLVHKAVDIGITFGATSIELTTSDLRELKEAIAKVPVQGDPYPEHLEKMTYR